MKSLIKLFLILFAIYLSFGFGYFIGKQFVYYDISDCYKGKDQTATDLKICLSELRHKND